MTINIPQKLQACLESLQSAGITSYFVGGAVRDTYMGVKSDDIDICLVGAKSLADVRKIIRTHCDSISAPVGESFSVLIADFEGGKYDFALARTEMSTGPQHRDFTASVVNVSIEQDLGRRDMTINAIAVNTLTGEVIDPYNGISDIKNRIARVVSFAFMEDPVRVFRFARFISSFNLSWDEEARWMCSKIDVTALPGERVGMELEKMFKQARTPSLFFEFLWECDHLKEWLPEFAILDQIEQDAGWHPEGNVMCHTLHCMNAATDPFIRCVMLCHDLGKATTTIEAGGTWKAPGHAKAGVAPTLSMLQRIKFMDGAYQKKVACLVENHMFHTISDPTPRAVKRMVRRLHAAECTFDQLVEVCRCDVTGRPPMVGYTPNIGQDIATKFVETNSIERIVNGDMLKALGFEQGRHLGIMLKQFENMQDEETLTVENWKDWVGSVDLYANFFIPAHQQPGLTADLLTEPT
jgi:tRNA nucleotidyltransferase (CCA-adding enzyme)